MIRSVMKKCSAFVLILSIAVLGYSWDIQKVAVKTEDGITVVYNPKKPVELPDTPADLVLTDVLRIGIENGDENYMFSEITAIQVDSEEDILVMDGKEGCIKVFDNKGKFIRRFGKKGQGPGEIQSFRGMSLSGDLITINDVSNSRFSYFNKLGECVKQIPIVKNRSSGAQADSKGFIFGDILSFEDDILLKLIKFDQEFKPIKTIKAIEMPKQAPPGILMEYIYFKVRDDDSLVWGRNFKYEINIMNRDGKLVRRIVRDFDPVKITVKNLKQEMEKRYPGRPIPKNFSIPSHFPKHFPVFYYFTCDDEGRIYVCHFFNKGEDSIYDVFDPEGRYFAKLSLPQNEILTVIKNGKAYFMVKENEEGIPQVKICHMEWR